MKHSHTDKPDCPACAACDRLIAELRPIIMRAGSAVGDLHTVDVVSVVITLLAESMFNSFRDKTDIPALGSYLVDVQHALEDRLASLQAKYISGGTNSLKIDDNGVITSASREDMAEATDAANDDIWLDRGMADRRAAAALSPADPANLHRRRNDLPMHDRMLALLNKPYRGKVH